MDENTMILVTICTIGAGLAGCISYLIYSFDLRRNTKRQRQLN